MLNYKWIAKQLRHKKWGEWRYSKVTGGRFFLEWLSRYDSWREYRIYSRNSKDWVSYLPTSEEECVKIIARSRYNSIKNISRRRCKNKAYSKRKWKYIP